MLMEALIDLKVSVDAIQTVNNGCGSSEFMFPGKSHIVYFIIYSFSHTKTCSLTEQHEGRTSSMGLGTAAH